MRPRRRKLSRSAVDAELLDKERSDIERQYIELDDAILRGQGSPRILEAAGTLVPCLLLHFTHEEQFRKQIAFPFVDDQGAVWRKNIAELLQIEAGLKQGEVYAALRLRGFCKGWMHEHIYAKGRKFELTVFPGPTQRRPRA
jgi:hemerythrin